MQPRCSGCGFVKNLTIRVNEGKRGKDGICFINDECASTLHRYLAARPPLTIEGRELFSIPTSANAGKGQRYIDYFVQYKSKANIQKVGGIHVFSRHSPATLLLSNGCDISIVQKILRHSDIRTTLRYTHLSDKVKRENYERCIDL